MKQYSTDLRTAVVHALDTGATPAEIARLFGVSRRSVTRWRQLHQTTGQLAARPRPGASRKLTPQATAALRQRVADHPDATLHDHCVALAAEWQIQVSVATMSRTMGRLDITQKKDPDRRRARSGRGRGVDGAASRPGCHHPDFSR